MATNRPIPPRPTPPPPKPAGWQAWHDPPGFDPSKVDPTPPLPTQDGKRFQIPADFYDDPPGRELIATFNSLTDDRQIARYLRMHNRIANAARWVHERKAQKFSVSLPPPQNQDIANWMASVFTEPARFGL